MSDTDAERTARELIAMARAGLDPYEKLLGMIADSYERTLDALTAVEDLHPQSPSTPNDVAVAKSAQALMLAVNPPEIRVNLATWDQLSPDTQKMMVRWATFYRIATERAIGLSEEAP